MITTGGGESHLPTDRMRGDRAMKRTYFKAFFGTNEAVEAGVRKFDQVFRRMYNVYGGRREYSGKDSDGNYEVVMSYTADWIESWDMFPEFSIGAIAKRFSIEASRLPSEVYENLCMDVLKDEHGDRVTYW